MKYTVPLVMIFYCLFSLYFLNCLGFFLLSVYYFYKNKSLVKVKKKF